MESKVYIYSGFTHLSYYLEISKTDLNDFQNWIFDITNPFYDVSNSNSDISK